jgi:hypothetical protein
MSTLPSDELVARSLAETRASVLEATHRVRSPKRSTRFRYTRNAIIAGGAVILLTAGALAVALENRDVIASAVTCYRHASLDSYPQGISTPDRPLDPIALCSDQYPTGTPIAVCTLPNGTAGVFPREGRPADDFCETLGLADWDSD